MTKKVGRHVKHGHKPASGPSKEYKAWENAKRHCFSRSHPRYEDWGGQGVTMCEEWAKDFTAFLKYVGPAPSKQHSLDRIDPYGNYKPGNVRWATAKEQANNRRCHWILIPGCAADRGEVCLREKCCCKGRRR